jgi:hypothetical protein
MERHYLLYATFMTLINHILSALWAKVSTVIEKQYKFRIFIHPVDTVFSFLSCQIKTFSSENYYRHCSTELGSYSECQNEASYSFSTHSKHKTEVHVCSRSILSLYSKWHVWSRGVVRCSNSLRTRRGDKPLDLRQKKEQKERMNS